MVKVNMKLLPIKMHYFFFMAASGPILPYLTVYGKQLGISAELMGSITAVLPLVFLFAKPIFGYIADLAQKRKKYIFIGLVLSMSSFYLLLYFVPQPPPALQFVPQTNESMVFGNCTEEQKTYSPVTFYSFVALMCLSMVAYNVANSVSDAICFDMLGAGNESKYGFQRVWGAIGFGLTALLGGLGMDLWSFQECVKNYTPAFVMVAVFTAIDLFFCHRLKLPKIGTSENILKDVGKVLREKKIIIFLIFATLAGVMDSFIIYFMFWFLEDIAASTNQMATIKTIEGLIVAAETLGGEVIFFPLSGRILKKLGTEYTFSLCFLNYALRLGLISIIPSPWWLLPIELFMQGPTYALCYTTIVAYASSVSLPGTSATMQGLVAGMDDGMGYAIGSLMGGFMYRQLGGRTSFQLFSLVALICSILHTVLFWQMNGGVRPKIVASRASDSGS